MLENKAYQWRPARVVKNSAAAHNMISLVLRPDTWIAHRAGQHYEIRLARGELSRKYSVAASSADEGTLEFGVQILPTGMVSPRLAQARAGDALEIRGPLGEAFLWTPAQDGPMVLLGAGSGVTPLLEMHAAYTRHNPAGACSFLVSAKTPEHIFCYHRFKRFLTARFTATAPRIDKSYLKESVGSLTDHPETRAWICGPPRFIDAMVDSMLELGLSEDRVRSETYL